MSGYQKVRDSKRKKAIDVLTSAQRRMKTLHEKQKKEINALREEIRKETEDERYKERPVEVKKKIQETQIENAKKIEQCFEHKAAMGDEDEDDISTIGDNGEEKEISQADLDDLRNIFTEIDNEEKKEDIENQKDEKEEELFKEGEGEYNKNALDKFVSSLALGDITDKMWKDLSVEELKDYVDIITRYHKLTQRNNGSIDDIFYVNVEFLKQLEKIITTRYKGLMTTWLDNINNKVNNSDPNIELQNKASINKIFKETSEKLYNKIFDKIMYTSI